MSLFAPSYFASTWSGPHLLFIGNCSIGGPSSSFVLQSVEFVCPHYKKAFLEVGFISLEKSGTWVHGFWPSWADAPAASQKCWVGVKMQQSCHCKLEKEKKIQRLYLPLRWPGHVTVTVQGVTLTALLGRQGNMKQCIWSMGSSKKHLREHRFEKKRESWLTQR